MLKMAVETITPEIAKEYLKSNTQNYRKIQRSHVLELAEDMKSGKWQLNGEAIEFNEDGILVNGQHRLAAIIYANTPVQIAVIRGVKKNVTIYDTGGNRTIHQMAMANNIDTNPTITAAANIIVHGFMSRKHSKGTTLSYISENESELNRAFRATCYGNNEKSKTAPCVAASYLMLRMQQILYYELELFWRLYNQPMITLCDGYDPSSAFVAYKMMEDRRKNSAGRIVQKERFEILVRALSDFHNGVHVTENYKIGDPFIFETLLKKLRKTDKLEG